jgi:hypothetical protein
MPLVSVIMPPFPAVLPFPGVPPVAVGFGASLGLPGGGIAGGFTVGPGGLSGGLSGTLGPVAGGFNIGPGGVSGGVSGGFGPVAGGVSITDQGIAGGLGGTFGPLSGGIAIGPDGISAEASAQLGPFGIALNASLPPLLTDDDPGGLFLGPTWGVFDADGQPVAPWDSVLKVDYRHEMRIADFPIEGGDFASYNKVQVPYDIRISFVVGSGSGGVNRRTALLDALEQAVQSLAFYTVATPEATYYRANLTHLEYARETRRGVNLLVADVWISEVRPAEGVSSADDGSQNPQSPTAQGAGNNGQTQPIDVPWTTATPVTTPSVDPDMHSGMPTLNTGDTPSSTPANMPTQSAPLVPAIPPITPAAPGPLPPIPAVMPPGVLF